MANCLKVARAAVALCLFAAPAGAQPLEATPLYAQRAKDCRALDLATWTHPTRKILEGLRIGITKVELCNRDIYPVFTVAFPASPMLGVNDRWFNKLYARMVVANGRHPFAFVDPGWGVVVYVDMPAKGDVDISYDEFDPPAGK